MEVWILSTGEVLSASTTFKKGLTRLEEARRARGNKFHLTPINVNEKESDGEPQDESRTVERTKG